MKTVAKWRKPYMRFMPNNYRPVCWEEKFLALSF